MEMLLDNLLFQSLLAEGDDPLVDAGLGEEFKGNSGIEALHMMREGLPDLNGGIGPAVGGALLLDELLHPGKEPYLLNLGRNGLLFDRKRQGLL